MSATTTQKKERAILDTFQLFYEELPTGLNSQKSTRLQRRSKR